MNKTRFEYLELWPDLNNRGNNSGICREKSFPLISELPLCWSDNQKFEIKCVQIGPNS